MGHGWDSVTGLGLGQGLGQRQNRAGSGRPGTRFQGRARFQAKAKAQSSAKAYGRAKGPGPGQDQGPAHGKVRSRVHGQSMPCQGMARAAPGLGRIGSGLGHDWAWVRARTRTGEESGQSRVRAGKGQYRAGAEPGQGWVAFGQVWNMGHGWDRATGLGQGKDWGAGRARA